jgi:hypothetical protein
MLNDVLKTPFVAILTRFVAGPIRPIRRDARVSAGFTEGKGTNAERARIFFDGANRINRLWVGRKSG